MRSKLSQSKQALLEKRLRGAKEGIKTASEISRRTTKDRALLSFAQQRIWIHDQIVEGQAIYNMPACLRLHGDVDVLALEKSITEIIKRHEILRTSFQLNKGEIRQYVNEDITSHLEIRNLQTYSPSERKSIMKEIIKNESRRPFDTAQCPLIRFLLFHIQEKEYVLFINMHHIVSDGWSIGILMKEITNFYNAFVTNRQFYLPALSIQYADYAEWQRKQFHEQSLQKQQEYWRNQLYGVSPLRFPTDHPRPKSLTGRGKTYAFNVPAQLTEQLRTLGKNTDSTLFMILATAFEILFYQYSGQEDIVVGVPVANRQQNELKSMIGCFINTLPLRIKVTEGMTVATLLQSVREAALELYKNQEVPIDQLIEQLNLNRKNQNILPLFQHVFVLQNMPISSMQMHGVTIEMEEVYSGTSKYDLTVAAFEKNEGIEFTVEYSSDLFESETIEKMMTRYLAIMKEIVTNIDVEISELSNMSEENFQEIVRLRSLLSKNEGKYEVKNPNTSLSEQSPCYPEPTTTVIFDRAATINNEKINLNTLGLEALSNNESGDFWKKKLEGYTFTKIPRWKEDKQKNRKKAYFQNEKVVVPYETSKKLKNLASLAKAPLKMVLLAAHFKVMSFISGQTDIVTGVVSNVRSEIKEGKRLVGLQLNSVPYRLKLEGGTWVDLVKQTFDVNCEIQSHSLYPMQQVQRDLGGQPLFEAQFNCNDFQNCDSIKGDCEWEGTDQYNYIHTDLSLSADFSLNKEGEVFLCLQWDNSEFSNEQIEAIVGYYLNTFEQMTKHPEIHYEEADLLSVKELEFFSDRFIATNEAYDENELCLHQFFELQVERTPDALAIVFEEEVLTYLELNERANQLAHYLREQGVGPEVMVGILMDRSIEMIISILGILKAGGAYVPIDPSYPQDRIAYILEDSKVPLLISKESDVFNLPEHNAKLIELDNDWSLIAKQGKENPINNVTSDNLAYIIYTSGSTGKPKGTLVEHGNVVRLFLSTEKWYNFSNKDVWTMFHSFAFDFSVWELWGALFYGGRLVVVPYMISRSPESFYELLCKEKVTVLNQTPSAFRQLMQEDEIQSGRGLSLRYVIFGGEALDLTSLQPWFERHGDQYPLLVNMYGITETTVHVTYRPISWEDIRNPQGSIIGIPIPDLNVYVLDQNLKTVPVGVPGEIYVGGPGVTRGYLNRLNLTQERFISNPYSSDSKSKLYKSGDLARYTTNGELEYLGRIDQQVKIRGFRIELGEIESILNQHSKVHEGVVIVREDIPEDKKIVAYIVGKELMPFSIEEVRNFMSKHLPNYMIPSAFVLLDKLPLTVNGKVDRKSLPLPKRELVECSESNKPKSLVEKTLTEIWEELLGISQVSIHDNFFEIGGNSLNAIQTIQRIEATLGIRISVSEIFENPLLADLVKIIEKRNDNVVVKEISKISRNGKPLQLSFSQEQIWITEQLNEKTGMFNVPGAIRLLGKLDETSLIKGVQEILNRHEILRTRYLLNEEGKVGQVISSNDSLQIEKHDISNLLKEKRVDEVQRFILQECKTPFDLANDLLIRGKLIKLEEQEHVLIITMHHICTDGWSTGVFVEELSQLYSSFVSGKKLELPLLSVQYADYAHWQRIKMQETSMKKHRSYWMCQLGGELPVLRLPTGNSYSEKLDFSSKSQEFTIDATLSGLLKKLTHQADVTLFMIFMSAYQILLAHYAKLEDIIVGTPVANRNHMQIERLIGCFINPLPLRTDLSGNPSLKNVLERVRQVTLDSYEHQEYPFELLLHDLKPARSLGVSPIFQVMFTYHNTPSLSLQADGLTMEPVSFENQYVKYDLLLNMTETQAGVLGWLTYKTSLFDELFIKQFIKHFKKVIELMIKQPELSIKEVSHMLNKEENRKQRLERVKSMENRRGSFGKMKPKKVQIEMDQLVHTKYLNETGNLMLMIQPSVKSVDLIGWAKHNLDYIESEFQKHGSLLFRGFSVQSMEDFKEFTQIFKSELESYQEYSTPRTHLENNIYTSTEYPKDQEILMHNENSYTKTWPLKLLFCSLKSAEVGGETPLADSRKVYELLSEETRNKFENKQILYVRNYGEGIDLPWQTVFQTEDPKKVEAYCQQMSIEYEWLENGRLRTKAIRPAVAKHPLTGEKIWFNQAHLFHVTSVPKEAQESLLQIVGEEFLPRNTYYGDGTPIEPEVMDEIREVYRQATVAFKWEEGDILIVDNMKLAHGRRPFEGTRKVVVAMLDLYSNYGM
ncbi:non-ribosomal peptide synthetase [Bacillus thuringiensis]|uniref:non-ribosomal peptide synthetase n=1 Tax=Bacillus thuringiensis TaxID=1428 RepID=UPI0015967CB1|nr:non-ribosomal peptide synthetase [Bacillus thuringiensis]